jgi:hypothetical protein
MIAAVGIWLSKFGSWVANNRAVQWVLGALGVIVMLLLWGERREKQGRTQEKLKQKERDLDLREEATETANQIIEQEKTDADAAQEAGALAGSAEPNELERMSDAEWELTFGRERAAGDPGFRS